jgi:hypothetical protein
MDSVECGDLTTGGQATLGFLHSNMIVTTMDILLVDQNIKMSSLQSTFQKLDGMKCPGLRQFQTFHDQQEAIPSFSRYAEKGRLTWTSS